ncbi:MAG TPA: LysR family transcriptional regulator [Vicinamibacterales bacterium]|nr:LysR family transcriptional regulator [Vicinamibacterales bacterium]
MEVRHIQAFIAVAEELSLRRAGRRLGVSQASISRQVQQLEQELGLTLFLRRRDGIELTHQGTLMLDQAMRLAAAAAEFADHMKTVESHRRGVVRLGIGWGLWDAVNRIRARHEARATGVAVLGNDMASWNQVEALRQRRIDVGLLRLPCDTRELQCAPLYNECVVALLPATHPLAGRSSVKLHELAHERLLLHDRDHAPIIYDKIFELYSGAGITPHIVATTATPASAAGMINVASGKGIYIGLGSLMMSMKDAPGIAVVRIEDPRAALQVCVVWRASEASPAVLDFVEAAREAFTNAPNAISRPSRISAQASRRSDPKSRAKRPRSYGSRP